MALRLKPETREAWQKHLKARGVYGPVDTSAVNAPWRPVPRSEPVAEPPKSLSRFDIYHEAWVDSEL